VSPAIVERTRRRDLGSDLYNLLSIEIERAEVLTDFLARRLSDLGDVDREMYAFALIAQSINERHAAIRARAEALDRARAADVDGAQ